MKLSNILKTKGLLSATIHNHGSYVVAQIFVRGEPKSILKVFRNIGIDVSIQEISNDTVKHLGIKKYFYLGENEYFENEYYINYYIY